jgi:hypothetical protein
MPEYNDGTIPHGSRILTINSVAYAAESFDLSEPMEAVQRKNVVTNAPAGAVYTDGFVTGTATCQLDNAENPPTMGLTFITPVRGTNANFVVTDVGTPEAQGELKKFTISFARIYN